MQKNEKTGKHLCGISWSKALSIMKLTSMLILLSFLQVSAHVYSQDARISIHVQSTSINKVLREIERKSNYKFFYNNMVFPAENMISINFTDTKVSEILYAMLKNTDFTYKLLNGNLIALVKAENASRIIDISGIVNDEKGLPLPGVSVKIKGTGQGVSTGSDGRFKISVPDKSSVLLFSFIGYTSKELTIGEQSELIINLEPAQGKLDEVVVVGYGTQKKSKITGAISSVKSVDFADQQIGRVEDILKGRAAGVSVTASSGMPGTNSTVRIRGNTSLNSEANKPLYIVDGNIVDNGNIDFLNSSDIQTIDVLKDAASAAIYGARSSAGVILITTKSGNDKDVAINLTAYNGIQEPAKKVALLDASQYATLINEQAVNGGGALIFSNPETLGKGTDWQKTIFNNSARIQDYQLNISTGNDKSKLFSSLGYYDQDGIVTTSISNYKRINLRLNTSAKLNKWLTLGENIGYSHTKSLSGTSDNTNFGSPISSALNLDPTTTVKVTDPSLLTQVPYSTQPVVLDNDGIPFSISKYVGQQMSNPYAYTKTQAGNYTWADNFIGNAYLEFNPLSFIKFKSSVGVNLKYSGTEAFLPKYYLNALLINTQTSFQRERSKMLNWNVENTLSFNKSINEHSFNILLGQGAYLDNNTSGLNVTYYGIPATTFTEATMNYSVPTTSILATGYEGINHTVSSLFSRVEYSYSDKYLFTGIIRRDGSSRFAAARKFGYFPSASLGWIATNEGFLPRSKALSFLKFRASYGVTGSDYLGDFSYVGTVSNGSNYTFGSNNTYYIGSSSNAPANANLKWEETHQVNIGVDAVIFNGISISADLFNKTTSGILMPVTFPAYTGATGTAYDNIGNVSNKGVEFTAGIDRKIGQVALNISGNISYIKNRVSYLGNGINFTETGAQTFQGSAYALTRMALGQPVNAFYGFKTNGIFQNQAEVDAYTGVNGKIQPTAVPGDFRWVDVNHDGKITDADRVYLGDPNPNWTYGLTIGTKYKSFELLIFGQGVIGNTIFQGLRRLDVPTSNWQTSALNRWHGEGTSDAYPRLTTNDTNNNFSYPSDYYLQDGSYFRIKTLQLGYRFPKSLISKLGIKELKLYVSTTNVLTLTRYTGYDPEIGGASLGVDRGIYPQAKSFLIGTNFSF